MTAIADAGVEGLLGRLIGFDTTSDRSNLPLIDFVEGWLADHGVASERIPDDDGGKANLLATIGPPDAAGIVLSGHTDVVPVAGQDWSSDPFTCTERDGRLYGRGSADMKGFLAVVLSRVPEWKAAGLTAPVHLAFSYDEEVGCLGVPRLIDRLLATAPVPPRGCIVGEPTMMTVVDGHKGKGGYRCTVTGRAAHSALTHQGVNAIEIAAEIVAFLRRLKRELAADGPFADGFDPPYTTVSTGEIAGGTALNIVAEHCTVAFEFRTVPGVDPASLLARVRHYAEELLPEMRRTAPESGIVFEELLQYPALASRSAVDLAGIAGEIAGTTTPGRVSFGTEAGHFAARGIPTVVCGPGDIRVAHRPDEHVARDQLARCAGFLDGIVARMAGA